MSTTLSKSPAILGETAQPASTAVRRVAAGIAITVAVAALAYVGVKRWQFAAAHEDTDDAQVEGHVSPVLPRVAGYVGRVLVNDNQRVTAGQVLLEIDGTELDLKVQEAQAALASAEADLRTAEASVANAQAMAAAADANVQTALVRDRKTVSDLARDAALFKTGAITDSQLTDTQAAADTAKAQLEALRQDASASRLQVPVTDARVAAAQTQVAEKRSSLDFARLQRSYGSVTAPISGLVSRKSVEPGQFVQAGQTLLSVAAEDDAWVVANFKETQLTRMKVGQTVDFTADTYPDVIFHGKVDSIAGTTGARFALLPPDNSTGNFVKVTQRIPVKILHADPADPAHPLRPGMSVDAVVQVR